MFLADLDPKPRPEYIAGSYVLGESKVDDPYIRITGRHVRVRRNLYDFLSAIRSQDPLTLWIDALCIDQDNVLERNHQVSMMRLIYTQAKCVSAWLGPAAEDSECVLELIRTAVLDVYPRVSTHRLSDWVNDE